MLGHPRLGGGRIPAGLSLLLVLERDPAAPSPLLRGCHPGEEGRLFFKDLVTFLAARLGVRQCAGGRAVFLQNGARVILVFILCCDRPAGAPRAPRAASPLPQPHGAGGENVSGEQL